MSQTKPVQLDLARDLPKVRNQYPKVLKSLSSGSCDYTAPCVIGAMVPPRDRGCLQHELADTTIGNLIGEGLVVVPKGQRRDFTRLQKAFDDGDKDRFERTLAAVELKYLPVVSA